MFWRKLLRCHIVNNQFLKLISLICFFTFASVIWLHYNENVRNNEIDEVEEALEDAVKDMRYTELSRKTNQLPKDTKYILLWTPHDFSPFYYLEHGQKAFIKNNCSVTNCFVTTNRLLFGGDVSKFDAIAFNGRNVDHMKRWILPRNRSATQKYIYFNLESSDNYPMCEDYFDNFFNWTATYKLDSDIPFAYVQIKNNDGEVVGPKANMDWETDMPEIDEDLSQKLHNKSKAAAWFVSNCSARSKREKFVKDLQKVLSYLGLNVDVYGSCGNLKCPKDRKSDCDMLLEKDYYFYLSLENSFSEDYVTEKILSALQHYAVPIVYGGADYSRFLPPDSYLDGRKLDMETLAKTMLKLMSSNKLYQQYFRWRNFYSYHDPLSENICSVCAALHNQDMVETPTVYSNFREWWNPDYRQRCRIRGNKKRRKRNKEMFT